MMALGSLAEEAKWRRLFVRDAVSQSWKLQFEAPDGKRYDSPSSRLQFYESSDTESIISSLSSHEQQQHLPSFTFCKMKSNIIDLRRKSRKRRLPKCLRLPVPPQSSRVPPPPVSICILPLIDVFQNTPLSQVRCVHCFKSYSHPDLLSVNFIAHRLSIECDQCGCLTIRVFTSWKVAF